MADTKESGWLSRRKDRRLGFPLSEFLFLSAVLLGVTFGVFLTANVVDFGISSVERVRHHSQIQDMEEQILKIAEICND